MAMVTYKSIKSTSTNLDQDSSRVEEYDQYIFPIWSFSSPTYRDILDLVLPSDEASLEAMTSPKKPWEYMHHRSYFPPKLSKMKTEKKKITMNGILY